MEFKEEQLVRVEYIVNVDTGEIVSTNMDYNNDQSYKRNSTFRRLATWVRVKFIDNDGTFVGEAERIERNTWSELDIQIFNKGEQVRIAVDRVNDIANPEMDFCYSDDVTQCSCPGLCRNK